jgi:hypothetical protein
MQRAGRFLGVKLPIRRTVITRRACATGRRSLTARDAVRARQLSETARLRRRGRVSTMPVPLIASTTPIHTSAGVLDPVFGNSPAPVPVLGVDTVEAATDTVVVGSVVGGVVGGGGMMSNRRVTLTAGVLNCV